MYSHMHPWWENNKATKISLLAQLEKRSITGVRWICSWAHLLFSTLFPSFTICICYLSDGLKLEKAIPERDIMKG